jgi:hypothetical protein
MKRLTIFSAFAVLAIMFTLSSCHNKRDRGLTYMPDMAYSRTYEAYDLLDSTKFTMDRTSKGGTKIFFNAIPPAGTIKRGEEFPYTMPDDSIGYNMSSSVKNPLDNISANDLVEAGRLYNINCGVCHGPKGLADGPLAGTVGGIVNLTLDQYKALSDGTIFHVVTYGKNNMGSYASQLNRRQRWMVVKYVRSLQNGTAGKAAVDSTGNGAKADSSGIAKKG